MGTYRLPAILIFIVFLAGCRSIPVYLLLRSEPHKDMLHLVVYLEDRAGPEVYRKIALDELARIRADRHQRAFPLYEVAFEFRKSPDGKSEERLAQVLVYLGKSPESGQGPTASSEDPRIETILY